MAIVICRFTSRIVGKNEAISICEFTKAVIDYSCSIILWRRSIALAMWEYLLDRVI